VPASDVELTGFSLRKTSYDRILYPLKNVAVPISPFFTKTFVREKVPGTGTVTIFISFLSEEKPETKKRIGPRVLSNPLRDSRRAPRGGVHIGRSTTPLEVLAPRRRLVLSQRGSSYARQKMSPRQLGDSYLQIRFGFYKIYNNNIQYITIYNMYINSYNYINTIII